MLSISVYLFSMIMDFVLSGILFNAVYRFSDAGVEPWVIGAAMAVWSAIYSVCSLLAGKFVKPANAHIPLITAGITNCLVAIGFLTFDGLYTQFTWLAATGVSMAFFYTPFQIYMKYLEPKQSGSREIVRPSALYLAAWSFGFAMGPIAFGCLSYTAGFLICAAGALAVAFGVLAVHLFHRGMETIETDAEKSGVPASPERPDLVWIGWLIGGAGVLAISVVRSLGPFRGVQVLSLTKDQAGIALASLSFIQSLTGLLLIFSKDWMYRRIPVALLSAAGIASLMTFAFCSGFAGFVAASLLFGLYSGLFYFIFVYHSLAHPVKSGLYISINETIVGVTGVLSPLLGGALVTRNTCHWVFIGTAVIVFISLLIQLAVFYKKKHGCRIDMNSAEM